MTKKITVYIPEIEAAPGQWERVYNHVGGCDVGVFSDGLGFGPDGPKGAAEKIAKREAGNRRWRVAEEKREAGYSTSRQLNEQEAQSREEAGW